MKDEKVYHLFFGLEKYFLPLLAFSFLLTSCDFFPKSDYNKGYTDGYYAGYSASVRDQKNSAKNDSGKQEVRDPAADNFTPPTPKKSVSASGIPQKVYQVLDFIKKKNHAPEGYVGGRHFGNYEHHLPERDASGNLIDYKEWDVNPKVDGKDRGVQRLITGSDGRAWYTDDHYNSFSEVK